MITPVGTPPNGGHTKPPRNFRKSHMLPWILGSVLCWSWITSSYGIELVPKELFDVQQLKIVPPGQVGTSLKIAPDGQLFVATKAGASTLCILRTYFIAADGSLEGGRGTGPSREACP
jgi:hypothetical protein